VAPAGAPSSGGSSSYNKAASAEQVAEQSRGDVSCPAKIKTPPGAAQGAVDDVVGVRPGLSFEEAVNVVLCTDKLMVAQEVADRGINMETYGQKIRQGFAAKIAEARVEKTSRQIMKEMQDEAFARSGNSVVRETKPGQSRWYVGTMGLPGTERVISAAREEWFDTGRNPTSESIAQALLAKYGAPTRNQNANGRIYLTWVHDLRGALVPETSQLANACTGVFDPNGGANYSPNCGLVVAAMIHPLPDNAALSQFIQVGVVDEAGGYQAVTATEAALKQFDAQRKAQQVQEAAKNADAPKL
jgi:hypothetical protein